MKIGKVSRFLALLFTSGWILLLCTSCEYFTKKEERLLLKTQLDSTKVQFQRLRQQHNRLLSESGQPIEVGFEVQIGAFRHFDLDSYSEDLVNMKIREAGDINRYVLGSFTSLEEAQNFLKDIKLMGVQDAFIGGVIDGKRVSVKEAQKAASSFYGDW